MPSTASSAEFEILLVYVLQALFCSYLGLDAPEKQITACWRPADDLLKWQII